MNIWLIFYREYNLLENKIKCSCLNMLILTIYIHIFCIYNVNQYKHKSKFVVSLLSYHQRGVFFSKDSTTETRLVSIHYLIMSKHLPFSTYLTILTSITFEQAVLNLTFANHLVIQCPHGILKFIVLVGKSL